MTEEEPQPFSNWRYKKYKIKLRPEYNGRPMRPGFEVLDGKVMELMTLWAQEDDDPYPGEKALGQPKPNTEADTLFRQLDIGSIASGDTALMEGG